MNVTVTDCGSCPLRWSDTGGTFYCMTARGRGILSMRPEQSSRIADEIVFAEGTDPRRPDWCILLEGPVTVAMEESASG